MNLKEFKKWGKKDLWNFNNKVAYSTPFGMASTTVRDIVASISDMGVDPIQLVVAIDKNEENWEFTEALGKYCVELTTDLLSEQSDYEEDKEWKKDYILWLKSQLKKLEEEE